MVVPCWHERRRPFTRIRVTAPRLSLSCARAGKFPRTLPVPYELASSSLTLFPLFRTHYSLCHGDKSSSHALTTWRLQASLNGSDWQTLVDHKRDTKLHLPYAEAVWPVPSDGSGSGTRSSSSHSDDPEPRFWRFFQIVQVEPNSSGQFEINLCGLEYYGRLRFRPTPITSPGEEPSAVPLSPSSSSSPPSEKIRQDSYEIPSDSVRNQWYAPPRGSQTQVAEVVLTAKDQKGWF